MNASELATEMLRLCRQLDQAQAELDRATRAEAEAERTYRSAKANAYLASEGRTIPEREAQVDKTVADERYRAHLAEGLAKSALEAVRNLRAQLSVLQTVSNSHKAEAEFARTGPNQ